MWKYIIICNKITWCITEIKNIQINNGKQAVAVIPMTMQRLLEAYINIQEMHQKLTQKIQQTSIGK